MNNLIDDYDIDVLDPKRLNEQSKFIYDTYLSITGLKELPDSDYVFISQVARDYYAESLCSAMKGITTKDSFIKAKNEGRIKDFKYFMGWLNFFNNTRIKKDNYEQQFENIEKFFEDNKNNEPFLVLKEYIEEGKIAIISSNDAKDMYEIFKEYSVLEIDMAIKDCKDNIGNKVYNLKYLFSILKRVRSDLNRLSEKWDIEQREMSANVSGIFNEKEYKEPETEEERLYYLERNKALVEEIQKQNSKR
jgi:hypothetical protein